MAAPQEAPVLKVKESRAHTGQGSDARAHPSHAVPRTRCGDGGRSPRKWRSPSGCDRPWNARSAAEVGAAGMADAGRSICRFESRIR